MNSQPKLERARCPRDGYLIGLDGRCWFCRQEPDRKRNEGRPALALAKPQVELEANVAVEEQLLLSEELFQRYEVPSVRVGVSGTMEVPLEMLREMSEGLEPGDAVSVLVRGHVLDVSVPYSPGKDEHRGRLVIRAEVIGGLARMVGDA